MAWHRHVFKHGFWDGNEDQLMEMEMLDARNPPATMDGDGMWEEDEENEKPKPSLATHPMGWHEDREQGLRIQVE